MSALGVLSVVARELALFAAVGFLVFAADDLFVDILYFSRRLWRAATVYRRHPRSAGESFTAPGHKGWLAVFVPAWDEGEVVADMIRSTLARYGEGDYRLFVGHYRNDPRTAEALAPLKDPRLVKVRLPVDGPTTKADCLNHLYLAMEEEERRRGKLAKGVVLHDAEDVVHPMELRVFDRLLETAGAVQLPVVPLPDPGSRWISGHYCDEFAESHGKELVVREAMGAAVPLAGVACAIRRDELASIAAFKAGLPFAADSMTEDYELGLKLGQRGVRSIFARVPAVAGGSEVVASQGHFPGTLSTAVRQKSRWLGGIAFSGWERLGWHGSLGERWFRLRDRRGPLAAILLLAGYLAFILLSQLWLVSTLSDTQMPPLDPLLTTLLGINAVLLLWRLAMRMVFTARTYGTVEGLRAAPRLIVANTIAIFAGWRALRSYVSAVPTAWDKTAHHFPQEYRS